MSQAEPRPTRVLFDEDFLDEGPVRLEHLNAIVDAIANIQQIVVRQLGAMHRIAELLRGRRVGIVGARVGVVGLVAVGAPMPLVLAGIGVEHDHAMIPVAVGDIQLIGLGIDERLGGQPQILDIVAAFALLGLPICIRNFPS